MYLIEKISNNIAVQISSHLDLGNEKKEIIEYGAFTFLQAVWAIFWTIVFGVVFNVLMEALVISFSGSMLRKYSGGAHATSPNRCALIGAVLCSFFGIVVDKISNLINIGFIVLILILVLIFSYYIIYKLAPVDNPNKRILKEKTKQRLKKSSIVMLNCFLGIIIVLLVWYSKQNNIILLKIVLSLCAGITWQCITLTGTGHSIMNRMDTFLKHIII